MLGLASILNPMKHRGRCQSSNVLNTNRNTVRYHNTIPNRLIVPLLVDILLEWGKARVNIINILKH